MTYFVGMHALSALPTSMLSGDKSLLQNSTDTACSANVGFVSALSLGGQPPAWDSLLHPNGGNLLLNDGRVEELSAQGLASYFMGRTEENGVTHYMRPQ